MATPAAAPATIANTRPIRTPPLRSFPIGQCGVIVPVVYVRFANGLFAKYENVEIYRIWFQETEIIWIKQIKLMTYFGSSVQSLMMSRHDPLPFPFCSVDVSRIGKQEHTSPAVSTAPCMKKFHAAQSPFQRCELLFQSKL